MLKTRFVHTVLATLALILLSNCTSTPAPVAAPTAAPATKSSLDMTPATIHLGITNITYPTLITAQEMEFFTKENLTVKTDSFGGGGLINEALAAGHLDMGITTPTSAALATVKGVKAIMISGFENTFIDKSGKSWEAIYAVVRGGEGIQNLSDLKGKKVAVADISSFYNIALRARMSALKIDPDKELTIVPVPYAQMPGALMQKLVDAVLIPADGYLQVQKLGKVEAIATHTSLMNVSMDLTSAVSVSAGFLQKQPDQVVRFLRALVRARQWMAEDVARNDGKNLIDLVAKSMKFSPEQAKTLYDTRAGYYGKELDFVNLLDIPTQSIARDFELLKAGGSIKQDTPTSYEQVVDIRPLKQAYESLGLQWDASKH